MLTQTQIILGLGARQLTPVLVQQNRTDYASSTSYNFTITSPPIQGNLMVLAVGGSQNRTATFPGGWTVVQMVGSGQTLEIGYKIAGAGETQSITLNFNLGLQGNIIYTEFSNVDVVSPRIGSGPGIGVPFASVTSASYGNFDVFEKCVVIQDIQFTSAPFWTANNSFVYTAAGASRHDVGYRIYSNPAPTTQNTTWSGASATGSIGFIAFRGKRL